jgi:hypothetical protein
MRLTLEVIPDAELDKQIVWMVRHRIDTALSSAEMRATIQAAAGKAVEDQIGAAMKTLVQSQLRKAISDHIGTRLKGVAVDRVIREIVTDLFKARFGKPKEGAPS